MTKVFNKSDIPPHTPAEVAEILNYIPPAPPCEDWIRICAGVCSEIGEVEALPVLLAWSPDYGDKKTETVLRSFRGTYKSTFATVIRYAQENGFNASAYEKARRAYLQAESGNAPASPRRERKEKADTAAPQPAKAGTQPIAQLLRACGQNRRLATASNSTRTPPRPQNGHRRAMNNPQEQALNDRAKIAETRLSEIEQTLAEMEKELAPRRVKIICISAVAAVGILALAAIEILTK